MERVRYKKNDVRILLPAYPVCWLLALPSLKIGNAVSPRQTSCKISYALIINTYSLLYFISDTFMSPYFWEVQNHFPWVKIEVQNMLNFESLSFYIR